MSAKVINQKNFNFIANEISGSDFYIECYTIFRMVKVEKGKEFEKKKKLFEAWFSVDG